MNPLLSTIISLFFLTIGAGAVMLMMARWGRRELAHPQLYTRVHRLLGWLFVVIFLVMVIFMLARVEDYWEETSARVVVHVSLAAAVFILLVLKVLIVRFFKLLSKNLLMIGLGIYVLSFVLVFMTAGYFLIWRYEKQPYLAHAAIPEKMKDERLGKQLFITNCSTCHLLREIMKPRSPESWEKIINEMVALAEPRISPDEAAQILHYLVVSHTPPLEQLNPQGDLVERHCLACHQREEIYSRRLTRRGWVAVVTKMSQIDPELVPSEKIQEIVGFLVKTNQPLQ